jgi:hypothetical protein
VKIAIRGIPNCLNCRAVFCRINIVYNVYVGCITKPVGLPVGHFALLQVSIGSFR